MRSGNFKYSTIIVYVACLLISFSTLSQSIKQPIQPVDDLVKDFKTKNEAENFIYAILDEYLKNPTEARLVIFDRYEKLAWRTLTTDNEHLAYTILRCNEGYYLTKFGRLYKAIEIYEEAWQLFSSNKLTNFDIIEYCLKPLATNYSILGDYASASNIVKNYLFIAERDKNYEHLLSGFINLSIIYHDTGKYKDAINLLEEGLQVKHTPVEKKGILYSNLARNYLSLHDLKNANRYGHLSLAALKNTKTPESSVQLVNVYSLLSNVSLEEKNIAKSLTLIKSAQQIVLKKQALFKTRDLAKLNNNYAALLELKGELKGALTAYQESLNLLLPGYQSKDSIPSVQSLYAENTIKETFDGIASVYYKRDQFEKTLAYFELSFFVEDLIRSTYNYEDAKLQQQIENRNRTERALNVLAILFNSTGNNQYATRAFQLAERTKALILKERIESSEARGKLKKDSLLVLERELHYKQATLASEISLEQMKQDQANITHLNELIASQTKISIELKETKKAIKAKHAISSYHNSKTIDLQLLHQKLNQANAILIEYFTGQNALYIFTMNSDVVKFDKVDAIDTLKEKIIQLSALLSTYSSINNNPQHYNDLAFEVFSSLQLPNNSAQKKLIIIPDGILSLIPFDALPYENTSSQDYRNFPFLVRKFAITYQSSALIYSRSSASTTVTKNSILGVFPLFKNTSLALQYSEKEASDIHEKIDGKFLYADHATKKSFLENAENYSIIHLSTHASSGSYYEPPSITFIDSTLYLPQVYGLQLKTNLLVLSACETGIGTVVKGEGAISLARGFQLAGVQNLIFSLWKVNDYSTATLMANFYNHYVNKQSNDESLQTAKLDYLADESVSNSRKSPYYWSGFVYYGSTEKSVNQSDAIISPRTLIIIALGVVLLFAFGFYLKKKAPTK